MQENQTSSGIKNKFLDRISFGVLLLVTFLAPIFFVPASFISTQFGTSLLFAFGVILVALIYIICSLIYGEINLPKPAKYILGFSTLVPLIYMLAGVSNGFSRMAFFGYTFDINTVGFILLGFAYLFLVSLLFRNRHRIFYSYFAFVISAIILAIFLLIRIIFGSAVLSFGIFTDLTSTVVGTWNNVGIFFGVGAILSLLTYEMVSVSSFMKVLLTLALVLSLFFLVLVNFNIIWIIVGICAFLFILFSIFSSERSEYHTFSLKHRLSKIPVYTSIVFVICVIFLVWGSSVGSYLSNKLNVTNIEVRPTLSVTLDIARNTINQRPLFGSGPNTFTTQWLTWKPDDIVSTIFWDTDFNNGIGLIPTFAVTTGLLGILSWFLFLGFYVYLGVKSMFVRVEDSFIRYLLTSSFFISLYLWIMAFVYVPSTVVLILTFFFTGLFFASVYLAKIIHIETRVFSHNPKVGFLSSLLLIAFFVGSVALGYVFSEKFIRSEYFK